MAGKTVDRKPANSEGNWLRSKVSKDSALGQEMTAGKTAIIVAAVLAVVGLGFVGYNMASAAQRAKGIDTSITKLQYMNAMLVSYAADNGDTLPQVTDGPSMKQFLKTYKPSPSNKLWRPTAPDDPTQSPDTHTAYVVNAYLAGKKLSDLPQNTTVSICEDATPNGGHRAIMLDGHSGIFTSTDWTAIKTNKENLGLP
jgi:hypothetical protein